MTRHIVARRQPSDVPSWQRHVINDKKTRLNANQAICFLQQSSLEGSAVPNPGSDEMM